ncbi:MAG TPA: spore coat protein [Clostridiales bacterium]|mgnify:CR=1 FL=1|jgi:rubrerythrin|nr:spore coat protein [Clostridiales bacterium]HBE12740.1 spore coat protein [Clostridiales bacterium]HCG35334.1 spore coat protein [Clostridiales bacterium]
MANLTTKELGAITDQLASEKVLVAKYRSYAQKTQDPELKSKYEQVASKHTQHFDKLYAMLS